MAWGIGADVEDGGEDGRGSKTLSREGDHYAAQSQLNGGGCVRLCTANGTVHATERWFVGRASPFRDRVFAPRPLRTVLERRPTSLLRHGRGTAPAGSQRSAGRSRIEVARSP